jgi:hypothetical protein
MVKQAEGSVPSLLLALAAAIAPAVVKALIERRSRTKTEEQLMCHNHSHLQGRVIWMEDEDDATAVGILVTQALTVENSCGARLTLPQYTVLSVRLESPTPSSVLQLRAMAAQAASDLYKADEVNTSGLTTQQR